MEPGPSTFGGASLGSNRQNGAFRNKRPRRATIGNEIDQIILHEMKMQVDNGPVIPLETEFIFFTNKEDLPPSKQLSGVFNLKTESHKGYFDQPKVIEAFRRQLQIETPDFEEIGPSDDVDSPFTFADDDGVVSMTDTAYEKRHRRWEKFEKSSRLREVEKLQNKQYHIHERIDQLKLLDSSSFLPLDTFYFYGQPCRDDDRGRGAAEAERRRKQMIDAALDLETRLKESLPSKPKKKLASTQHNMPPLKRAGSYNHQHSRASSPPWYNVSKPQYVEPEEDHDLPTVAQRPKSSSYPPVHAGTSLGEVRPFASVHPPPSPQVFPPERESQPYIYLNHEAALEHPLDYAPVLDDDDDVYVETIMKTSKARGRPQDEDVYVEDNAPPEIIMADLPLPHIAERPPAKRGRPPKAKDPSALSMKEPFPPNIIPQRSGLMIKIPAYATYTSTASTSKLVPQPRQIIRAASPSIPSSSTHHPNIDVPQVASYPANSPLSTCTSVDDTEEEQVDQLNSKLSTPALPEQPAHPLSVLGLEDVPSIHAYSPSPPPDRPSSPTPGPSTMANPLDYSLSLPHLDKQSKIRLAPGTSRSASPYSLSARGHRDSMGAPTPPPADGRRSVTRQPEGKKEPCALRIAGQNLINSKITRQPRHLTAFGVRFPAEEMKVTMDYKLPPLVANDPLARTGIERIEKENPGEWIPIPHATTGPAKKKARVG